MARQVIQGSERLRQTLRGIGDAATPKQGRMLARMLKMLLGRKVKLPHVSIGFFENERYDDGTYVAQVAFWNEFGTKTAPARPFMRVAVKAHEDEWGATLMEAIKHTDGDLEKALGIMGMKIAEQVKQQIIDTNSPPNTNLTNILKDRFPKGGYDFDDFLQAIKDDENGETAPAGKVLDWSGRMLQSVTWEVSND